MPDNGSQSAKAPYSPGTILEASTGEAIDFETMIKDLESSRIVYVGETHTDASHHDVQLDILKSLHDRHPGNISVGMEMFARPYQQVLSQWADGEMSEEEFLRKTHWYANWRFDFSLYRDLLHYIRDNRIPLYGLNIEFHIPSKIAAGGLDSLLSYQAEQLPEKMDFTNSDHRAYVKSVYDNHGGHVGRRYDFESFYAAQVVWDEVMAESVSEYINGRVMVVFAGRGHIVEGFGIPERAHDRTGLAYRTITPQAAGKPVDFDAADYIWITQPAENHAGPDQMNGAMEGDE